jgi:hypothetical protein
MGQAAPKQKAGTTLEANQLLIRDDEGRKRIALGFEKGGGPMLEMFDANGNSTLELGVLGNYAHCLIFKNARGTQLAYFSRVGVRIIDDNGKLRGDLRMGENVPHEGIGKRPEILGLRLFDENGRPRAELGYPREGSCLRLFDEAGRQIWAARERR